MTTASRARRPGPGTRRRERGATNPSQSIRSATPSSTARRRACRTISSGPSPAMSRRTWSGSDGERLDREPARSSSARSVRGSRSSGPPASARCTGSRRGSSSGSGYGIVVARAPRAGATRGSRAAEVSTNRSVQRRYSDFSASFCRRRAALRDVSMSFAVSDSCEVTTSGIRRVRAAARPLRAAMFQTPCTWIASKRAASREDPRDLVDADAPPVRELGRTSERGKVKTGTPACWSRPISCWERATGARVLGAADDVVDARAPAGKHHAHAAGLNATARRVEAGKQRQDAHASPPPR